MKTTKLVRPQPNTRQLDEDVRAAHEYATALAWMTETLDEGQGIVFQRIAKSILTHINAIELQLESFQAASTIAPGSAAPQL